MQKILLSLIYFLISLQLFSMEQNDKESLKRKCDSSSLDTTKRPHVELKGLQNDELQRVYQRLFCCHSLKRTSCKGNMPKIPDIGMGCIFISDEFKILGTHGLGPCFAVGATGLNGSVPLLALAHQSTNMNPKVVLERLHALLSEKGCSKESIKIYVFGGQEPYVDSQWGLCCETCLIVETDFLKLADQYNIVGAKFNLLQGEEKDFDVILTEKGMYYGYDLFIPRNGYEDAGDPIYEDDDYTDSGEENSESEDNSL